MRANWATNLQIWGPLGSCFAIDGMDPNSKAEQGRSDPVEPLHTLGVNTAVCQYQLHSPVCTYQAADFLGLVFPWKKKDKK